MITPYERGSTPLKSELPQQSPIIAVVRVDTPRLVRIANRQIATGYKDRFSHNVSTARVEDILCSDPYSDPSRAERLLAYVDDGLVREDRPDGITRFSFGKEGDEYPIEAAELVQPVDGWEAIHGDLSPGQMLEIGRISILRRQSKRGNTVPILRELLETGMSLPQISERDIKRAYVIMKPALAVRFKEAGYHPVGPFEVARPKRPTAYAQRTYDTFSYWNELPSLYYLPIEVYRKS